MTKTELYKLIEDEAGKLYGDDPDPVYENIFKSGAQFVAEKLLKEIEELRSIKRLYQDLCSEWNEACEESCNSYAHSEECKNIDLGNAKRSLQKQIEELKTENERLFIELTDSIVEHPCYQLSKKLESENKRMREALLSISKNSCCDQCQEAKLVAIETLNEVGGE